jgi:hypothetical protein
MGRLTKEEVADRFTNNIGRVQSLVKTYTSLIKPGQGRSSVEQADVLRAAIILLHAALEEVMRSTEELHLPNAKKEAFKLLKFMPLSGYGNGPEKISLVDLAGYRNQTVNDIFDQAIAFHLDRSNYNNITDLIQPLDRLDLQHEFLSDDTNSEAKVLRISLEAMMKRRHWIAHRADRNPKSGTGHHVAQSISPKTVSSWIAAVEKFAKLVIAQL